MSENLLEVIQQLVNSGKADPQRLDHIITFIKSGKKIYSSDQKYLEVIISKNITNESASRLIEEVKNISKSSGKERKKTLPVKTSPLWYYLPLFLNLVGGTISYFVLRKTDLQKAKKCFILGLALFLIPFTIFAIVNLVPGMQYSAYMVTKAIDEQNLRIYDVAIIDSNIPIENTKIGDVIIFYNPGTHQEVIIHRVVQIISKDPYAIKTKGDKSLEPIEGVDYPITKQEYIGKLVYTIPQVGYATKLVTAKSILITIAATITIGVVQHILYHKRKHSSIDQNNL